MSYGAAVVHGFMVKELAGGASVFFDLSRFSCLADSGRFAAF